MAAEHMGEMDARDLGRPSPSDLGASPQRKRCPDCAFHPNSPERSDPYTWMRYQESWAENDSPFYCHETVPGHRQEKRDGSPRWRPCAGWCDMKKDPADGR